MGVVPQMLTFVNKCNLRTAPNDKGKTEFDLVCKTAENKRNLEGRALELAFQKTVNPISRFGQILGYPLILQSTLSISIFLGEKRLSL